MPKTPGFRYPKLDVNQGSSLGSARAYDAEGAQTNGHLAVDQEGRVVFVDDELVPPEERRD